MNEQPKSIWRKPWQGWRGALLWFALLAATAFVVIFCIALTTWTVAIEEMLLTSLELGAVIALIVVLAILFLRWIYNWRNFRRFLFGVACVVTLIAIFYAVENWRGKRAWEAHCCYWEAKGEKFALAALIPTAVSDDQNFAMTQLLRPSLNFTQVNGSVVWGDTNGQTHLRRIDAQQPERHSTNQLALGRLEKGTLADLEACRDFYRGNSNYPQPAVSGTAAQDILVALGKFDEDMSELHNAAEARPYSRFPIQYNHEPSWGILLPHLASIKSLCLVTHVRGVAHLELRQSNEALQELKLGFRLSDSIRDEPILIDHLVRIAAMSINLQTVREGLVRHAWNEKQLVEIENYLASVNLLAEYKLAMRGERVFSTSGLDYMRRARFRLRNQDLISYSEAGFRPFIAMPSGWFYQNMLRISQMQQDFALAAASETEHRVFPDTADGLDDALQKMKAGPYNIFAKLFLPAVNEALVKSARSQSYIDATRVACALERYRLANGKLPDTLDQLPPRFVETIPNDVIDGKPLRYRPNGDGGYILYSIGWNKTDDGGTVGLTKGGGADPKQGDWVWQYPAK